MVSTSNSGDGAAFSSGEQSTKSDSPKPDAYDSDGIDENNDDFETASRKAQKFMSNKKMEFFKNEDKKIPKDKMPNKEEIAGYY